jgi:hypothetical protein
MSFHLTLKSLTWTRAGALEAADDQERLECHKEELESFLARAKLFRDRSADTDGPCFSYYSKQSFNFSPNNQKYTFAKSIFSFKSALSDSIWYPLYSSFADEAASTVEKVANAIGLTCPWLLLITAPSNSKNRWELNRDKSNNYRVCAGTSFWFRGAWRHVAAQLCKVCELRPEKYDKLSAENVINWFNDNFCKKAFPFLPQNCLFSASEARTDCLPKKIRLSQKKMILMKLEIEPCPSHKTLVEAEED